MSVHTRVRRAAELHVPLLALLILCVFIQSVTLGMQQFATPVHAHVGLGTHDHAGDLTARHAHAPGDGAVVELDDDERRNATARGLGDGGAVRTGVADNADRRTESPPARAVTAFRSHIVAPLERPPRA